MYLLAYELKTEQVDHGLQVDHGGGDTSQSEGRVRRDMSISAWGQPRV